MHDIDPTPPSLHQLLSSLPACREDFDRPARWRQGSEAPHTLRRGDDRLDIDVLDHQGTRLSALLHASAQVHSRLRLDEPVELLLIAGHAHVGGFNLQPGDYLRWTRGGVLHLAPGSRAGLYCGPGHFPPTDTACRLERTGDATGVDWLDGPAPGMRIKPLHGHGDTRVMLLQWLEAAEFRPSLNPLGESMLVLRGTLFANDEAEALAALAWSRFPPSDWPTWRGLAGTRALYKSGHFGPNDE